MITTCQLMNELVTWGGEGPYFLGVHSPCKEIMASAWETRGHNIFSQAVHWSGRKGGHSY